MSQISAECCDVRGARRVPDPQRNMLWALLKTCQFPLESLHGLVILEQKSDDKSCNWKAPLPILLLHPDTEIYLRKRCGSVC